MAFVPNLDKCYSYNMDAAYRYLLGLVEQGLEEPQLCDEAKATWKILYDYFGGNCGSVKYFLAATAVPLSIKEYNSLVVAIVYMRAEAYDRYLNYDSDTYIANKVDSPKLEIEELEDYRESREDYIKCHLLRATTSPYGRVAAKVSDAIVMVPSYDIPANYSVGIVPLNDEGIPTLDASNYFMTLYSEN